jgi:hypothetical protein
MTTDFEIEEVFDEDVEPISGTADGKTRSADFMASREVENGYNNNAYLPKPGYQINWTAEKIKEYKKCKKDPVYFAEKYFTILTADGDEEFIKLYDFQKEAITASKTNRRLILCTSRQIGKTTVATVIILHFALFNSGKRVALLANKGDQAREILERIQLAFEMLPDFLKVGIKEWNKGSVVFENRSKIVAAATSSSAIRGKSQSMVYIDETAFVENWAAFSASVLPTLSSGKKSKTIFTSTPNGLNHFHKYWIGANRDKSDPTWNGYYAIEVPWWKIPDRDEVWKQEILASIDFDYQKFAVEFCCEFLGSSDTLISGSKLKELVHINPIKEQDGLRIFDTPEEGKTYAMVCDVAHGKGLDFSAFHVVDITEMPYKQVACYSNNMVTPVDYGELIFRVAKTYNEAHVLIESNDIGGQICNMIYNDFGYENVLFTINKGRAGKQLYGPTSKGEIGVKTTKTVKSTGCSIFKMILEADQLIIRDHTTINEISTFSKKGTSYEAEQGCNDDLVMGLVLFGWMSDQKFFKHLTDIDTLNTLKRQSEEELKAKLNSLDFIFSDGLKDQQRVPDEFVDSDGDVWYATESSWNNLI